MLSLNHPYSRTAATEGYPPNVKLCREKLLPLGIRFRECHDPSKVPFEDESLIWLSIGMVILMRENCFDYYVKTGCYYRAGRWR